tara:strand:- start:2198 stop:2326 length:129 start_codon:yes stop_codon:yes gene_type:complete
MSDITLLFIVCMWGVVGALVLYQTELMIDSEKKNKYGDEQDE